MCRGPQQILRGDGGKGVQDNLQEGARIALARMLREGQGDHILLLRLYQVRECDCVDLPSRGAQACCKRRGA